MDASFCIEVTFCAHTGQGCSHDSIKTLILQSDEIWPSYGPVHKRIKHACMLSCVLRSHYVLRQVWNPLNSIDTLISLIPSILAKILVSASQNKGGMHACLHVHKHHSNDWHVPLIAEIP